MATTIPSSKLPPLLQLIGFFARPTAFPERLQKRFGDVFALRVPAAEQMVFLADPDLVKAVWSQDKVNLLPDGRRITLQPVMGPRSVLLQEGAEHLRSRKLMLPPFHGDRMRSYGDLIDQITLREIESWPVGEPFALMPRMQAITLDVILRAVFGTHAGAREDALRAAIGSVLEASNSVLTQTTVIFSVMTGFQHTPFNRKVKRMDAIIYEEIADRQAADDLDEREDILSLLIRARDEEGNPLDRSELRDQLVTLLLSGHETTATSLAWAFDALFRNPDVREKLEASLAEGDEYLDAVIDETLRIRPTVHDVGRRLGAPITTKDGRTIEAGTAVFAPIWLLHQREDLFPNHDEFRPERYLNGERPSGFAWIPFGGGMRRCLGASFAQFEMRRVLRLVLEQTNLQPATPRAEKLIRRPVTTVPEHGTPAILL